MSDAFTEHEDQHLGWLFASRQHFNKRVGEKANYCSSLEDFQERIASTVAAIKIRRYQNYVFNNDLKAKFVNTHL